MSLAYLKYGLNKIYCVGSNKTSSTSLTMVGGQGPDTNGYPVGTWVVGWVICDNVGTTGPSISLLANSGYVFDTIQQWTTGSPNTSSGTTATVIVFITKILTKGPGYSPTDWTINFNSSTTAKVGGLYFITSTTGSLTITNPLNTIYANNAAGSFLYSFGASQLTNTMAIGVFGTEDVLTPGMIADTVSPVGVSTDSISQNQATSGGGAASNVGGTGVLLFEPGGRWKDNNAAFSDGSGLIVQIEEVAGTTPVSATRSTTWNTLAQVTPATRATTWNVNETLTPVSTTKSTTWNVLATTAPSTRATTWNAFAKTTATKVTTWNTFAKITATKATLWNVLTSLNQVVPTTWNVFSSVTPATRSTTWNTFATITQTKSTTWNVAGSGVTSVIATRATTWNALATTTQTKSTSWNTRAIISNANTTTWNVFTSVLTTRTTTWGVFAVVQTTRSTTWNVLPQTTQVSATRTTTWMVLTPVTPATRSTTWNVFVSVVAAVSTTWNVMGGSGPLDSFSVYVWDGASWVLQTNSRRDVSGVWV